MFVTSYLQSRSLNVLSCTGTVEPSGNSVLSALSSVSSAATAPRGHSFYTLFSSISSIVRLRRRRSTLTRFNPGHALPQVHLFPERSFNSHVAMCHEVYCIKCTEVSFYDCLSSEFVCKRVYALSLCLYGWICFTTTLSLLFLQVHLMALPSAFGVKFHKCAQVHKPYYSNITHFFLTVFPLNSTLWCFHLILSCE